MPNPVASMTLIAPDWSFELFTGMANARMIAQTGCSVKPVVLDCLTVHAIRGETEVCRMTVRADSMICGRIPLVRSLIGCALLIGVSSPPVSAQATDEAALFPPVHSLPELPGLPDPFLAADNLRIEMPEEWPQHREYLKTMLEHYLYGRTPPRPSRDQVHIEQTLSRPVFDGNALEERYTVTISRLGANVNVSLSLIRSLEPGRRATIIKNCRVLFETEGITQSLVSTVERDLAAAREAVNRGYILCKFCREDLAPDHTDNRAWGVFPLYPDYDWGTIAVWAWGQQLVLDVLDELDYVNMDQVVYTGHSRGGQTAIAAGIFDERADVVAPCTGGFGCCATLRIRDAEQARGTLPYIAHLSEKRPYWFCERYYEFAGEPDRLPFDAHTLVALVAPRAFLNTNATEDPNNNTLAVEVGLRTGRRVYDWLGAGDRCRLHWRAGSEHAQGMEEWQALLDFSDEVFFDRTGTSEFNEWVYPEFEPELAWSEP